MRPPEVVAAAHRADSDFRHNEPKASGRRRVRSRLSLLDQGVLSRMTAAATVVPVVVAMKAVMVIVKLSTIGARRPDCHPKRVPKTRCHAPSFPSHAVGTPQYQSMVYVSAPTWCTLAVASLQRHRLGSGVRQSRSPFVRGTIITAACTTP